MHERPPCWPEGCPCPNPCARAFHERTVYGTTPLYGPWRGWRIAGDTLVSPDRDRIKPAQLRALIYLDRRSREAVSRGPALPAGDSTIEHQDTRRHSTGRSFGQAPP